MCMLLRRRVCNCSHETSLTMAKRVVADLDRAPSPSTATKTAKTIYLVAVPAIGDESIFVEHLERRGGGGGAEAGIRLLSAAVIVLEACMA